MIPAIALQGVTKYYKKFKAIEDISFEVQPGEFFGFLGPNGAGKTTTISVITGLANFQDGRVKIFGHDVKSEYREARALIGLAPQEFNFDPFLTVEQVLTFEGGYFGMAPRAAKARAGDLLAVFELTSKRREGYKRLSGGMKRRLLIARALMHSPKILILDEPTAGVDLELRYQLWDFLRKINREGVTIVLTTHYIEEAEKLCSRIGVIHQGKIAAMDSTDTLIRKMSGNQVELYLKTGIPEVPAEIKGVKVYREEDGRRLRFEEKENAVNEVLKALHQRGFEIEKIDVRRPRLEDAFLKLTGKKNSMSSSGLTGGSKKGSPIKDFGDDKGS